MRRAAFALLLAISCSRKPPEAELVKSLDAAAAWVPALQMTAEKWVANSVPAAFTASAADAARKEFAKARKAIAQSEAKPELRQRFAADFQKADDFAEALHRAAGRDDPRAIEPAIHMLPPIKADLESIQKQYGGGS